MPARPDLAPVRRAPDATMSECTTDADGTRLWYRDDELHRDDGPAFEWPDGARFWYRSGKHHRDDGPAVERPDGTREWWISGVGYTEEKWRAEVERHRHRMVKSARKRAPL